MKRADLPYGTKFRYIDHETNLPGPTTFLAVDFLTDEVIASPEPNAVIGSRWSSILAILFGGEVEVVP